MTQFDLVFTGAHQVARDELTNRATEAGYKVRSHFCSKTNLVVASEDAAQKMTTKTRKALERGVTVMSYDAFIEKLEKGQV